MAVAEGPERAGTQFGLPHTHRPDDETPTGCGLAIIGTQVCPTLGESGDMGGAVPIEAAEAGRRGANEATVGGGRE